jgi:hypothetical protein
MDRKLSMSLYILWCYNRVYHLIIKIQNSTIILVVCSHLEPSTLSSDSSQITVIWSSNQSNPSSNARQM